MTRVAYLPHEIRVPLVAQARRHRPQLTKKGQYTLFRPCLRWDFGFTCAICLVHEADLTERGIVRVPLMWIEHFIPQSDPRRGKRLAHKYGNCIYACRYCNNRRGKKANVDRKGRKLLDPTVVAWANHFAVSGHQLLPLPGDSDAIYTAKAYGINDAIRVDMRERRSARIQKAVRVLRDAPAKRASLENLAAAEPDVAVAAEHRATADLLSLSIEDATATLMRYQVVPDDAPRRCRCRSKRGHSLPKWMANNIQYHQL